MNKRIQDSLMVCFLLIFCVFMTLILPVQATARFSMYNPETERSMTSPWVTEDFRVYTDAPGGYKKVTVDGWISMKATVYYQGVEPASRHYTKLLKVVVNLRWYVPYYYDDQYADYAHIKIVAYDTSNAPCPATGHNYVHYISCPSHIDTGGGYKEETFTFYMPSDGPYWGANSYTNRKRIVRVSFAKDYYNCNERYVKYFLGPYRRVFPPYFYWHRAYVAYNFVLDSPESCWSASGNIS